MYKRETEMAPKAVAEMEERDSGGHPLALGGPVYFPDISGPITTAKDSQNAVLKELTDFQAELLVSGCLDEEFSVEELRIFSEDELVEKALEALKVFVILFSPGKKLNLTDEETQFSHQEAEDQLNATTMEEPPLFEMQGSNDSSLPCEHTSINGKGQMIKMEKGKKRGRLFDRDTRASELENSSFYCVEQFAILKQKQDADKAAARLHSFNGNDSSIPKSAVSKADLLKLHSLKSVTSFKKVKSSDKGQQGLVSYPEVVLCVEVYDNRVLSQKTQEIFVLGSQKLTVLRDNIHCSTNHLMEVSGQSDPSGYFLIEGILFNDMRDSNARDYSKPILEWLAEHEKEAKEKWQFIAACEFKRHKQLHDGLTISDLPHFQTADMDNICFSDLRIRLGSGYLFCHQGDCKHLIVIRDMRLIHPEDDQNRQSYPILTFRHRKHQRKCSVCKIRSSSMVTIDDRYAADYPCFFCKDCYYLLHYKEDGSLIYENFNVFNLEELYPVGQPK